MCGRYAVFGPVSIPRNAVAILNEMNLELDRTLNTRAADFNAAPTDLLPVVAQGKEGGFECKDVRWGLVPHWAKDKAIGAKMINARAETVQEKPAFRTAFIKRRCPLGHELLCTGQHVALEQLDVGTGFCRQARLQQRRGVLDALLQRQRVDGRIAHLVIGSSQVVAPVTWNHPWERARLGLREVGQIHENFPWWGVGAYRSACMRAITGSGTG